MTAPGVPQAHDRADRDGDEADLGGAGGRRAVLHDTDHGDLGRRPARRGRAPTTSPGYPAIELAGAPVGAVRVGEPARRCATTLLPPVLSGLPVDDRSQWQAFREEYHRQHEDAAGRAQRLPRLRRRGAVPDRRVQHALARGCNLYLFPEAADYAARRTARTRRGTGCSRRCAPARRPSTSTEMVPGDGKVVYLSLGSLGCMDVGLMQRLIDAMATTEHRTIVSMGPLKDQMTLGPEHVRRPSSCRSPRSCRSAIC